MAAGLEAAAGRGGVVGHLVKVSLWRTPPLVPFSVTRCSGPPRSLRATPPGGLCTHLLNLISAADENEESFG
jgi:hypothetical protein